MTSTLMVATILHARILSSRKKIENLEKKFFFLPELDGRLAGLGPPAGQQLHKPDFFTYSISSYFTFVNLIFHAFYCESHPVYALLSDRRSGVEGQRLHTRRNRHAPDEPGNWQLSAEM